MGGRINIAEDAPIFAHCNETLVQNADIPTVIVLERMPVKTLAYKNSFQENIKFMIDVTTSPGAARGSTTFKNAFMRLHPSIRADSSRSTGISSKKP